MSLFNDQFQDYQSPNTTITLSSTVERTLSNTLQLITGGDADPNTIIPTTEDLPAGPLPPTLGGAPITWTLDMINMYVAALGVLTIDNVWSVYLNNIIDDLDYNTDVVSYSEASLTYSFPIPMILDNNLVTLTKSSLIIADQPAADLTNPNVTYSLILNGNISDPIIGIVNSANNAIVWNIPTIGVSVDTMTIAITYDFTPDIPAQFAVAFEDLNITLACVAKDTQILMSDGQFKAIQDINRGDLVAGQSDRKVIHQVARVNAQIIPNECIVDIVKFQKGCLGDNLPTSDLFITGNHPIVWKQNRRPAKCFINYPGVTYYDKNIMAKDILPTADSQILYDLQFDHDGTYVANGLIVQSRCPQSEITPLPKDLYFDQNLWTDKVTWDSFDQSLPLNTNIINDIVIKKVKS